MKSIFYVSALLVLFLMSACTSEDTVFQTFDPVSNTATHFDDYFNAGLGDNPGIPAGPIYSFPDGIKVVGFVHGNAPTVFVAPQVDKEKLVWQTPQVNTKDSYVDYGYGSYVNLYFELENITGQNQTVTIPKGTICHEAQHDPQAQHGLLIKGVDILVPANNSVFVHLILFCVNAHFGVASSTDPYKIGIITVNPDLLTLCDIMDAKSTIDPADYGAIQTIIWKITDNGGFSQTDIDLLNAM